MEIDLVLDMSSMQKLIGNTKMFVKIYHLIWICRIYCFIPIQQRLSVFYVVLELKIYGFFLFVKFSEAWGAIP